MKTSRRVLSALLASVLIVGTAGCGGGERGAAPKSESSAAGTEAASTTAFVDPDDTVDYAAVADTVEEIDEKNEEGAGKLYEKGKKAGEINVLCYYDFKNEEPENKILDLFAERFGGTVKVEMGFGSTQYMQRLGEKLAAGDSPDLIRYEWPFLPGLAIENRFTALDDWLDIESPLWADMRDAIDYYEYKGKHYYFPQTRAMGYGITYNTAYLEEIGEPDPMDLYFSGEWTWDVFEEMMKKWKANNAENVGVSVAASAAIHLAATTGTAVIEYNGTEIVNNIKAEPVMRTMEFFDRLNRAGLIHNAGDINPDNDYLGPDSSIGWTSQKLLFWLFGPEWTLKCGQQTLLSNNLEGEIKFVPMPRDPEADKYYQFGSTYGYLIPAGAQNVQGAVSWILAGRIYSTDPDVIAEKDEQLLYNEGWYSQKCTNKECKYDFGTSRGPIGEVCPQCGTARQTKFKITYSPEQLQVAKDMIDPEKFTFVYDNHRGFGQQCMDLFCETEDNLFDTPLHGRAAFISQVDAYYEKVEVELDKYRKILAG